MKIAVVSHGDDKVKKWREISFANKEKYCKKHGYDFIGSDRDTNIDRHPCWEKCILIKEAIDSNKYNWIFWSDIDSLVVNMNIKLEQFISSRYDLIISHTTLRLNFGNAFISNSELSKKIMRGIEGMVNKYTQYKWKCGCDEGALIRLLGKPEFAIYLDRVNVTYYATYNKFPYEYQKGDFIIHFANKWKNFNQFKEMAI